MISRRTISFIGLWAILLPWLGFSWSTKTVLFSLTGLILLYIGNRHYAAEKRKAKLKTKDATKINNNTTSATHTNLIKEIHGDHVDISSFSENRINNDSPKINIYSNVDNLNESAEIKIKEQEEKPRPVRRKIESLPRVKKIAIKSEFDTTVENYNNENIDKNYEQNQIQ